jgi:hypothetical protein
MRIAAPLFTVVIEGILESVVDVAVYQLDGLVTSNGVVLSTPEKATIAPVVSEDPEVTEKT